METTERTLLRTVAFLVSAFISVSTFALFSSWAWTQLDATQQEAIAATNIPLIAGWSARASTLPQTGAPDRPNAPDYRAVTTGVADKQ
jgi:hypothetical protein